jgi:muramoyltetrapeptide carboxypeptidase
MNIQFKKPKKLVQGDTIGVVAPSAGNANIFPHRIDTAIKTLEKMGYKVKFATHSLERNGYVSASPEERASDIHDMFKDDEVSAIICTIGGDHSNQVLKYLDFELIKNNPKIFVGFSDISVLHYAFMKRSGLQTFYGPCLMTQFGEYPEILSYTLNYFNKALTSTDSIGDVVSSKEWTAEILDWTIKKDLERPRKLIKSDGQEWLRQGYASGKIIGGCVPSINHLIGTEYWIDPSDSIFFIDIPEGYEFGKGLSIYALDSYMSDLDNIGVFKNIKGLIVGRPYNYSIDEYNELKKIIMNYTNKYDYPILLNINIGHCDPIITLPLGVDVVIDSKQNKFSINESAVV